MAGCSIVVLMSLVLAAGLVAIVAIIGVAVFFLIFGVLFLILGFIVLKKKDNPQKYRVLRIVLISIGFIFLFIVIMGFVALVAAFMLS
ncbi:MAG: hypothetical protein ACRDBO_12910 [Lachnospiraceae bacterium]